ncbi:PEGA domain-containing protein [Candidatus Roizmanbacteria bacterium]|nr:PEGA domain-containing protein [Candidatus Roizmanbacteria bacterium]
MKRKLLLVLGLFFLFAISIAIRIFVFGGQNDTGRIKILSTPSAGVFIDNVPLGKTPYDDKIKPGEHLLKLIPEGNDSTHSATYQEKIKVYKNSLTYVNRELGATDVDSAGDVLTISKMETRPKNSQYGEVYVETDPSGAIVYLDNDEKGVAPLILSDVLEGDHELSVFMPGFARRTQKINVEGEYRVSALIKLAIDPTQKANLPTSTPLGVSPTPSEKNKVLIKDTPTGWLRVRSEPTVSASESARVNPGEKYDLLEEQPNWYKIRIESKDGWISSQYASKVAN